MERRGVPAPVHFSELKDEDGFSLISSASASEIKPPTSEISKTPPRKPSNKNEAFSTENAINTKTKKGVVLDDLKPETLQAVGIAKNIYAKIGTELVVTSGTDGKHKKGSLHPSGNAFDLRIRGLSKKNIKRVMTDLKSNLGTDYDVLLESDHIHIEFDPKGKTP